MSKLIESQAINNDGFIGRLLQLACRIPEYHAHTSRQRRIFQQNGPTWNNFSDGIAHF